MRGKRRGSDRRTPQVYRTRRAEIGGGRTRSLNTQPWDRPRLLQTRLGQGATKLVQITDLGGPSWCMVRCLRNSSRFKAWGIQAQPLVTSEAANRGLCAAALTVRSGTASVRGRRRRYQCVQIHTDSRIQECIRSALSRASMNRRGDYDQAASLLEQAVAIHPSDPALHVELGEAYRNLGAYQDAIGCCLIGLKLRPIYPEGWNTLGLALRGNGDLEGALEKFLKAIACSESFFAGHANAGLVLQELGRLEDAIPHLRRAEELSLGLASPGGRLTPPRPQCQEPGRGPTKVRGSGLSGSFRRRRQPQRG